MVIARGVLLTAMCRQLDAIPGVYNLVTIIETSQGLGVQISAEPVQNAESRKMHAESVQNQCMIMLHHRMNMKKVIRDNEEDA